MRISDWSSDVCSSDLLAGTFEHRFSGLLLTAVIIGGVVSLGIMGNYSYFGEVEASLPLGRAWLAVLLTGVICGLQIGRAPCRERVCQYGVDLGGRGFIKKKKHARVPPQRQKQH